MSLEISDRDNERGLVVLRRLSSRRALFATVPLANHLFFLSYDGIHTFDASPQTDILPPSDTGRDDVIPLPEPTSEEARAEAAHIISLGFDAPDWADQNRRINDLLMRRMG